MTDTTKLADHMILVRYKCDCLIMAKPGNLREPIIVYCPRHAAADVMYEALEGVRKKLEEQDNPWWIMDEQRAIEDAMDLADGKDQESYDAEPPDYPIPGTHST
jgi:hypothetical protein